jgi:hypothetical protein
MDVIDFIEVLFDREDSTCYSETPRGIEVGDAHHPFNHSRKDAFFSINAMNPGKTRADSSVIKYRNILIEIDKISVEHQQAHILGMELPYSTAVFSGSKSVHYIISLEEPLSDEQAYRAIVKRVYKAVGNDLVDQSCKNPSRFSRLPGHIRTDTGLEQKLLGIRGRVPNATLETWLVSRGAPIEEAWENLTIEKRSRFKNYNRLYGATKNFLMFGTKENWNQKLFKAAADLCRCGYNEEEAKEELIKITGTLDYTDIKTIGSAFKNELSKNP